MKHAMSIDEQGEFVRDRSIGETASPPQAPSYRPSPPPRPNSSSSSGAGFVVAVIVLLVLGELFYWKNSEPAPQSTQTPVSPSVVKPRLDATVIRTVRLLNQIPAWLQPLLGGRTLTAFDYPPPENMQITDRCPGEGCGYHRWLAMAELPLFDAWNSANPQQVYTISDRETVTAMRGVFITSKPGVIEILEPVSIAGMDAAPGNLFYTLMYLGEGWVRGVFHGRLMDLPDIIGRQVSRKLTDYEATGWVQIKSSTGVECWTNQGFSFSGKASPAGQYPKCHGRWGGRRGSTSLRRARTCAGA